MKVITAMIRRKDMGFSDGLVETYTKGTSRMMNGMEMVRCNGLMVADMTVNGSEVSNMGTAPFPSLTEQIKKATLITMSSSEK
jgi:hypothetical protein